MDYVGYTDPNPVNRRLFELGEDETACLREIHARFGQGEFTYAEVQAVYRGRGKYSMFHSRVTGYLVKLPAPIRGKQKWRISTQMAARFSESEYIEFEPYKMPYPPYNRYKCVKHRLIRLGMTLDRGWYYCQVVNSKYYEFVMAKARHLNAGNMMCPVYLVDWSRCEKWIMSQCLPE